LARRPIRHALPLCLVAMALVVASGGLLPQQKINSSELDMRREVLREARDAARKNYYDLPGIKLDPTQAAKLFPFEWLPL
jgi:hypothetical protein